MTVNTLSPTARAEINIVSSDDKLYRLLELLLSDMGYLLKRANSSAADSILIVDLDSAPALPTSRQRAVVGISRNPEALSDTVRNACRHILSRPVNFSELHAVLEDAVLNAGIKTLSHPPAGSHNSARLTLDCVSSKLRYGRRGISLTPAEFRLAACLIDHQGSPVDTDTLLSALGEGDKNVLRVHICALRKKAEQLTGSTVIKTVRGKGYMI